MYAVHVQILLMCLWGDQTVRLQKGKWRCKVPWVVGIIREGLYKYINLIYSLKRSFGFHAAGNSLSGVDKALQICCGNIFCCSFLCNKCHCSLTHSKRENVCITNVHPLLKQYEQIRSNLPQSCTLVTSSLGTGINWSCDPPVNESPVHFLKKSFFHFLSESFIFQFCNNCSLSICFFDCSSSGFQELGWQQDGLWSWKFKFSLLFHRHQDPKGPQRDRKHQLPQPRSQTAARCSAVCTACKNRRPNSPAAETAGGNLGMTKPNERSDLRYRENLIPVWCQWMHPLTILFVYCWCVWSVFSCAGYRRVQWQVVVQNLPLPVQMVQFCLNNPDPCFISHFFF